MISNFATNKTRYHLPFRKDTHAFKDMRPPFLIEEGLGAALDYAHSRGAIHRDVKPSNIIFDETSEHVTLTDFGIVKALEATTVQTTGGGVLGTPAYASPEQAESKPLDGRSDLYSLGVVAYELCAGQVPFVADTTPSLFYKIVHEAPAVPSKVNPRVTAMIERVLLKAIDKLPDQRYATGREFAQAFSAAVEHAKGELLQSLCARARSALAARDFDTAEANLGQALAIQASHQEAQALLKDVRQKREAARRYTQLVQLVNQARAQAVELKQADPDLADQEGVLGLLAQDTHALQARPGHVRETPSAAPVAKRTLSRPQVVLGLALLVGAVIALIVGLTVTQGIWIQSVSEDDLPLVYVLIRGNVLIGAGLGGALGSLLILAFSVRKAP
jgi:hypothetical protein